MTLKPLYKNRFPFHLLFPSNTFNDFWKQWLAAEQWFSGQARPWQDHLRSCRYSLVGQAQAHPESLEGTSNFLRIWICKKFPRYWSSRFEEPHRTSSLHRELQFPRSHLWLSCCERKPFFLFLIRGSMAAIYWIMVWMWDVPNSSHVWTVGLQLMLQFVEVIEPLDMRTRPLGAGLWGVTARPCFRFLTTWRSPHHVLCHAIPGTEWNYKVLLPQGTCVM